MNPLIHPSMSNEESLDIHTYESFSLILNPSARCSRSPKSCLSIHALVMMSRRLDFRKNMVGKARCRSHLSFSFYPFFQHTTVCQMGIMIITALSMMLHDWWCDSDAHAAACQLILSHLCSRHVALAHCLVFLMVSGGAVVACLITLALTVLESGVRLRDLILVTAPRYYFILPQLHTFWILGPCLDSQPRCLGVA